MVLPDHLVDDVLAVKGEREGWTGVLDQLTLADLITSGGYDRHVRRMRRRYRRRRDQLRTALERHAPHVHATGISAGLHAVLRLPPGTERSAVKAATWQGVALDGLAAFRHPAATMPAPDGLVVGYATPSDHAWTPALDALVRAHCRRRPNHPARRPLPPAPSPTPTPRTQPPRQTQTQTPSRMRTGDRARLPSHTARSPRRRPEAGRGRRRRGPAGPRSAGARKMPSAPRFRRTEGTSGWSQGESNP